MSDATERRQRLKRVYEEARGCTACLLHQTRTNVVFGAGNADADLMFVGEGPGANEDKQGLPFVGRAGRLLDTLLQEVGLARDDVFIANTVKCRPPGNRDPHPNEIESCHHFLRSQVELIEPKVICTLGNFATKLLRADPTGISRVHGQDEVQTIGARAIRLLPLFHPAAALYTPSTLDTLRADFARIPELLALDAPAQPVPPEALAEVAEPEVAPEPGLAPEPELEGGTEPRGDPERQAVEDAGAGRPQGQVEPEPDPEQLGLF